MISDYQTLLQELRHRYELKYGRVIDDEILYIIIRINELQVEMLKEFNRREAAKKSSKNNSQSSFGKKGNIILIITNVLTVLLLLYIIFR